MELPQPRPFETKGRKSTHDFLSIRSHSTVQSDPKPTPSSSQGGRLKTHDFLQPLESVGAKEEISRIDTTTTESEKPPPPAPPPQQPRLLPSSSLDHQHVLPGGIGTYTISPIPYFHHQSVTKPEMFTASQASGDDENSNSLCSSYAASGFTLWDESSGGKKGQTRKENVGERLSIRADAGVTTMGQWPGLERRSQSLTNNNLGSFSSRSSSQGSGLKSQSFMDMIRSAKGSSQDDDLDDDEDFVMKKETSSTSQRVDLRVKADGRGAGNDQKVNTPRSKHSATEQRRRSKINDRFQMLRQLIPNSDQKRDKASFLLEVIEYIQFLQDKANKYETPYQGWNQEPRKPLNWQRNSQQSLPEGTVTFTPKLEEKNNIPVIKTTQSVPIDHHHPGTLNRAMTTTPFSLPLQSNTLFSPVLPGTPVTQFHTRMASPETTVVQPNRSSRTQPQPYAVAFKEEEDVHEGNISVSSAYSKGLVKTLKEALENSGVDLAKATISVEIELAKQSSLPSSSSSFKDHETRGPCNDDGKQTRKPKRLKTGQ